jgi:2Fe-2S ferredoxin
MPKIEFTGNHFGANKTIETERGGDLVDICDEYFAPIPFSCRSASCGTCHVEVIEGESLFEPPSEVERELLEILRGPGNSRLACQARVKGAPGLIKLRSLLT